MVVILVIHLVADCENLVKKMYNCKKTKINNTRREGCCADGKSTASFAVFFVDIFQMFCMGESATMGDEAVEPIAKKQKIEATAVEEVSASDPAIACIAPVHQLRLPFYSPKKKRET